MIYIKKLITILIALLFLSGCISNTKRTTHIELYNLSSKKLIASSFCHDKWHDSDIYLGKFFTNNSKLAFKSNLNNDHDKMEIPLRDNNEKKVTKASYKKEDSLLGIKEIRLYAGVATILSHENDSLKLHDKKFKQVLKLELKKGDFFTISDHHHWHDSYKVLKIKMDEMVLEHTHTFTSGEENSEFTEIISVGPVKNNKTDFFETILLSRWDYLFKLPH